MVINAKPKAPILFGNEQDWGAIWGIRRSDESMLEHKLNLLLCFLQLKRTHLVERSMDGRYIILQIDVEFMSLSHWR